MSPTIQNITAGEIIPGCWSFVIRGHKEADGGPKREGPKEKSKTLLDLSPFNKLYTVTPETITLNSQRRRVDGCTEGQNDIPALNEEK